MEKRALGTSGLSVSALGLGTWAMGGGTDWGNADDAQSLDTISAALERGINFIDTAPIYGMGHAEEIVGQSLKGRRDQVILATKCGLVQLETGVNHCLAPGSVARELEGSLKRLQTDYVDLYQIHWPDPKTPLEETLSVLLKLQKQGKIRHIGVSNFDVDLLEKAAGICPIASVQNEYSFLSREKAEPVFPFCQKNGTGFIGYGSLAGGILSGKYKKAANIRRCDARSYFYHFYKGQNFIRVQETMARFEKVARVWNKPVCAVALNWALLRGDVSAALCGARTPQQIEQNEQAGNWKLAVEDIAFLEGRVFGCVK